ncbi:MULTISPECIES: hypothetical protein [Streptomyces]|uniref:Uncharacterized protein n=1 Tax=Streptomyces sudanensis TaxID=436397 RepID=A0ABY4T7W2_9ACTN|nr:MULTISPECIES: hypothetical protein [Streptomyces]URN15048.1 hypothetical protein MW084_02845 [Streptomyces sudanensis]
MRDVGLQDPVAALKADVWERDGRQGQEDCRFAPPSTPSAPALAAEPARRAADLAAFREIREGLEWRLDRSERRIESLTVLVRAFAGYVAELTGRMREHPIEPPVPPQRVNEYDRTGV